MTLRELRIGNVAVIAEASAQMDAGFSALTGETGAGKSVCVNALRVAIGGRADPDMVRPGAEAARVAAVFDDISEAVCTRLAELGIHADDVLTLSRDVPRSGRSTCRINGAMVSQAVLREIGESLVEVTAQGASQRLVRRAWQRDLLDAAGGDATHRARESVEAAVRAWRDAAEALDGARRAARSGAAELARAGDLVADLEPLGLRAGEDAGLAAERLRLRHAARIAAAAEALAGAAAAEEGGAADGLAAAMAAAHELGPVDPVLQGLAEQADALVEGLRELALDARRHAGSVSLDDARLADVEERLDLIARVVRRHGSIEQALLDLDEARQLVEAAGGGEEALGRLEAAEAAARREVAAAAARLSSARAGAARSLERAVTAELRDLELPQARFRVVLTRTPDAQGIDLGDGIPVRCGARGAEEVDFRFTASRDVVPVPLDDGPSGGELSRIALALSAVAAEESAPALVLDEVDTGIGGETAARVGDVLAGIGRSRQVIAITHRPEIASRALGHLVVSKRESGGAPAACVRRVDGVDRVREVARLMSGRTTEAALRRAEELLAEGAAARLDRTRAPATARTM